MFGAGKRAMMMMAIGDSSETDSDDDDDEHKGPFGRSKESTLQEETLPSKLDGRMSVRSELLAALLIFSI